MKEIREDIVVGLPKFGEYNAAFRYIIECGLRCRCVLPPPVTRITMERGDLYSPETICVPYKTLLGSMLELIDLGVNTIIMPSGLCRLGYFGELQDLTLKDLGYDVNFINFPPIDTYTPKTLLAVMKRVNPAMRFWPAVKTGLGALRLIRDVDAVTARYYRNCGFALDKKAYASAYKRYLDRIRRVSSNREIKAVYREVQKAMDALPVQKPEKPIRVGILGEYYTVMDAESNLLIEQKLADLGVEVHRWMNLSETEMKKSGGKDLLRHIGNLCRYTMGPTANRNLYTAQTWADSFDGLVHIKSANCAPEIDLMPVLSRVSAEHNIPILFLTFDTQSGDAGLQTRLEAFYDMIMMKRKGRK